jgi:hypothetical protein
MSSDKLSSIQEPIFNLDLDIQRDNESKITSVELDKQDLMKMITTLEAANKVRASILQDCVSPLRNEFLSTNVAEIQLLTNHLCKHC